MRLALRRLGHPESSFASVLVAGTNGKGSVCCLVDSVVRACGYRTGLFTSPHLLDVTERVRVDGRPISKKRWNALERALGSLRRRGPSLTEFEIHTLLAFLYFKERGVEIAVVETGLGGRLDATNALPAPEATAITSIGHDHLEWLGPTLRHVYLEKAGIARPGTLLVQNIPASLKKLSRAVCETRSVPALNLGDDIRALPGAVNWERGTQVFSLKGPGYHYRNLAVPFLGRHQLGNAALAAQLCRCLAQRGWQISEADIRRGFSRARWPARFQVFQRKGRGSPVIVDGAHNPEGARSLARAYRASPWGGRKAVVIFGCLKDKDARSMAAALGSVARLVLTVPLPTPRGRRAPELAALCAPYAPARACGGLGEAWRLAGASSPVIAAGSLHLAGDILYFLRRRL